ncbi:MAG: protein-L-isoaspartate(D-aspartate) O-methyltransferase [Candidatus Berkelbacteria bacterium Licking1014_7]|uniref:Protein-L-isoaspartate O-methyltransferase n=1 Tax=Candidatus Berkelbacteria bacterium Licking1014_7 TaxID=2017147 RepID=A0A554LJ63_9BACT|nr:MAG: protein-L-isoaspartate(D-aspartate) O-methyltransferase [Candidatus Berkelbacteria bacterium Licking1014_7]
MSTSQFITELINSGYLKTPRLIRAFEKIDRADFTRQEDRHLAYANFPLPIGYDQTISQPLTVAFMLELLEPKPDDKILDIGAGSGWQTALLAQIVGKKGKVLAIEIIPELVEFARQNISQSNLLNKNKIKFFCQNARKGLPEEAPFDKIIVAAEVNEIFKLWKNQLKIGGRLVAPVKNSICLLIKKGENKFEKKCYFGFTFVPFV